MNRTICAVAGCLAAIEAPHRRFCTPHRQEHAQRLLASLQAIQARFGDDAVHTLSSPTQQENRS